MGVTSTRRCLTTSTANGRPYIMAIVEDGGVTHAPQVEISALNPEIAEVATGTPERPEHTLPFVAWKIGGGCGRWGTPAADYSEGWDDGSARAVMLLNAMLMAGKRHELPYVLRSLAVDQVEAGLSTSGHKGAILGFLGYHRATLGSDGEPREPPSPVP
jgi:hypothetical protein